VDASFDHFSKIGGSGAVIRDSCGQFIAALQQINVRVSSAREAEAMTIREALSWIKERNMSNVIIESDSQLCVTACNSSGENLSLFGLFILDCKSLLKDIANSSVRFARRSANSVDHLLAMRASSLTGRTVWEPVPPPWILNELAHDLI
jgi:ribonuclease HI